MSTTTTTTILRFAEAEDRAQKQAAFRKQFAANLNAALDRRGAIPSGYGRVVGTAELFGVSQNTAASWVKGEGVPELSRLPEIAEILGTTIEQLVVGEPDSGTQLIDENYVMIDMHEGEGVGGYSWFTLPETLRSLGMPKDIKMLLVKNDDMAPFVSNGEVVIYDPRVKRILSNGVFVLRIGDQFVVRRVQRGIKQNIRLICDNPLFDDEVLNETDFSDMSHSGNGVVVAGQVVGRMLIGS